MRGRFGRLVWLALATAGAAAGCVGEAAEALTAAPVGLPRSDCSDDAVATFEMFTP